MDGFRFAESPVCVCLLAFFAAGAALASESWEAVCAEPAAMPEIEQVIAPLPQPGEWKGKGFGDKRKSDLELEDCGRKIVGLVGVRLRGNVVKKVPLELDEDDGRYKASFEYTEGGMAAVRVTWDLEVESESRIAGRMTIMGRGDNVHADLLEAKPSPEMTACECEAVKSRRDELQRALAELEQAQTAAETAVWGWTTDPETCSILASTPDKTLPTQASFEVLMRADWEGELVRRERCCAVHGAGAGSDETETRKHEIAALTAEMSALETWVQNSCE